MWGITNKDMTKEDALRRWNELKIIAAKREMTDAEMDELDAVVKIANN